MTTNLSYAVPDPKKIGILPPVGYLSLRKQQFSVLSVGVGIVYVALTDTCVVGIDEDHAGTSGQTARIKVIGPSYTIWLYADNPVVTLQAD